MSELFSQGSYGYIAEKDLATAKKILDLSPQHSAFLSQQSVEKILKQALQETGISAYDLFKTHTLKKLARNLHEFNLDNFLVDLTDLTDVYFNTRYPGEEYWEIDLTKSKKLLSVAIDINSIVIKKLIEIRTLKEKEAESLLNDTNLFNLE